jgi:predicted amidohydrolase
MKLNRRCFLKAAGAVGLGASSVWAGLQKSRNSKNKTITDDKAAISTIRVAQVKVYPQKGQMRANHRKLMDILKGIEKNEDVDVVVMPEGFLDGYVSTEQSVTKNDMIEYAIDPFSSEFTRAVSKWAGRNKAWIVYGCTRKSADGVFNTALIYNRGGVLVGMYDKLHLQTHDHKYTPGKHLDVYESDFGPFGVMICADRRWPETSRTLTLEGARVIFNPTYGMHGELNLCMMRTRSYENGIYIVFTHPGQALITDHRGAVVCNNTDDAKTYIVTEIDLSKAPANKGGHIVDRRTDVYKL